MDRELLGILLAGQSLKLKKNRSHQEGEKMRPSREQTGRRNPLENSSFDLGENSLLLRER